MGKVKNFQRFATRSGSMLVYTMCGSELGSTGQYDLATFSDDVNAGPRYPVGAEVPVTPDLWELSSNQHNPEVPRYVMRRGRQREAKAPDVDLLSKAGAMEGKIAALSERVSILTALMQEIASRSAAAGRPLPADLVEMISPRPADSGEIPF